MHAREHHAQEAAGEGAAWDQRALKAIREISQRWDPRNIDLHA